MHILLVDQDDGVRTLFSHVFSHYGYRVTATCDPNEALEVARNESPSIIFSSIIFPLTNGFELCKKLREIPGTKDSLIIALTGYSDDDIKTETLNAGFDEYLLKPVSIFTVLSVLGKNTEKDSFDFEHRDI